MLTRDSSTDGPVAGAGACADCGAMVPRRTARVDKMTRIAVELCDRCCCVAQQRQVFAGGCCE